jgi:UDP-N-acetylmuramyl pentapeptide phosphotransferase/UDP-N-acetylglucosamine-1-phosphate transferase
MKLMKKIIIQVFLITILTTGIITGSNISAQNGSPPPPPGEHGSEQNLPPGGGTPIGGGLGILLALGAAYGGKKVWDFGKRKLTE